MGELFHTAVATLARSLETREPDMAHKPNVPRFRSNMGIAVVLLIIALGLGVAEVTAEGIGYSPAASAADRPSESFQGNAGCRFTLRRTVRIPIAAMRL